MNAIHVVLVRSKYSRNIGLTARALQNMGGEQLILVDPNCEIDEVARQGAAGAQDKLQNIKQYSGWSDFLSHESGLLVSLTRRAGRRRPLLPLDQQIQTTLKNNPLALQRNIYLILGPEDHGLSDEDMKNTHFRCSLPTFDEFSSLNLSHAALLATYIIQKELVQIDRAQTPSHLNLNFPDQVIRDWIEATGFNLDKRRVNAFTVMKRLLLQNVPSEKDLSILNSILQQNIRKLSEKRLDS